MAKKLDRNIILKRFYKKHKDRYNYPNFKYENIYQKIEIICNVHGSFNQTIKKHMNGSNCPKCAKNYKLTTETFIEKAIKKHGIFYDYSKVKYIESHKKVIIICPKHGDFEQRPNEHLSNCGCPKCANEKMNLKFKKDKNKFIKQSNKKHNFKYNYDKTIYINAHKKVFITCPNHGDFEQTPNTHLKGSGCPKCTNNKSKGEKTIQIYLLQNNINFYEQFKFNNCKNKFKLPFDFYLPTYNICIEFDGKQHYEKIQYWGGKKELLKRQKRDKIKTNYCKENNIKLIRIKYNENIIEKLNEIK